VGIRKKLQVGLEIVYTMYNVVLRWHQRINHVDVPRWLFCRQAIIGVPPTATGRLPSS